MPRNYKTANPNLAFTYTHLWRKKKEKKMKKRVNLTNLNLSNK